MVFPELRALPNDGVVEKMNLLVDAAKTDDEIGMVLRLHLILEQFLTAYLDWKISADIKKYVPVPRNFGEKLSLSVAFGLSQELAEAIFQFNKIRNRLSHGQHMQLEKEWVQEYLRAAEAVAVGHGFKESLQEASAELSGKPAVKFGIGSLRTDVFIAWVTCWHAILDSMQETNSELP